MIEVGLMLGAGALLFVGALLIEPWVIGAALVPAGVVSVMRFNDQRLKQAQIASASAGFVTSAE
jgi:hypothetical protein